jgi:hypothetical protein
VDLLKSLEAICDEIFEKWDKDQRSGKLLSALAGRIKRYRDDVTAIRSALTPPSDDMEAAKKIEGDVLVWYPRVKLDADDNLTDEVTGGAWAVTNWVGSWNEPDFLSATGPYFDDDESYASEPTHWLPVPAAIDNDAAKAKLPKAA